MCYFAGEKSRAEYVTAPLAEPPSCQQDFYFSTLCYQLTLYLIKCTLIVQYLRIFGMSRGTRIACWVALVFLTLFSGALLMAGIFACWPIYAFWDVTYPGRVGACVALNPMWYAHSGLSIFTDVVIFVIPLPLVRSLRLSMAEKTATLVLFGFGSFGVLASIIRLHELYELSSAADVTWEAVRSVWSVVEVSVFIICACVTGLKPFFDQKVLPLVMRVMPASTTAGSLAVKSTGSPRTTPPWMRSMTRRLGRRRPGTGTPRLSTLRLGTMRFFATTTRADDGESAIGIAPPAAPTFEMRAYAKEANDTCADDNQGNGSIARCSFHSVYKPETSDDHDNTSLTPCTTQKSGRST